MTTTNDTQVIRQWIGHDLADEGGHKIGRVEEVYVDDRSSTAEWIAVTTGMFGTKVSFVPLRGLWSDGDRLVSPWSKDQVKDAPQAEADGHLSPEEEERLYQHYDMRTGDAAAAPRAGREQADVDAGHDTSGPDTDDAMTRSEEELRVGTTEREAGRARLRKWVETEHQTVTVPVRKEKAQLVTEPITDANADAAMSGPDLSEEEHEIVLSEEVPVVDTQVVPKERVRLEKERVTDQERVDADLRKERIEAEGDIDLREDANRPADAR
jgi:uncharacterized protein (TIGR02271 family)